MMQDDRADLITSQLKQLEAFNTSLPALNQGAQQLGPITNQWNALRDALSDAVLPRLGTAVQLASRSMIASISSYLASFQHTENIQQLAPQMRQVWITLMAAQVGELAALLRNPPEVDNALAELRSNAGELPDRQEAKNLLVESGTKADDRATAIRRFAISALIAGIVVLTSAAAVPFVFRVDTDARGWALAAAWGCRVIAVTVLIVGAIHLLNVFKDLVARAANATREKDLFRALAASSFVGGGKEYAAAVVDLVRSLAVAPEQTSSTDSALIVPSSLVKELPDIIKMFRPTK